MNYDFPACAAGASSIPAPRTWTASTTSAVKDGRIGRGFCPPSRPPARRKRWTSPASWCCPGPHRQPTPHRLRVTSPAAFGLEADLCGVRSGRHTHAHRPGPAPRAMDAARRFPAKFRGQREKQRPLPRIPFFLPRRRHGRAISTRPLYKPGTAWSRGRDRESGAPGEIATS